MLDAGDSRRSGRQEDSGRWWWQGHATTCSRAAQHGLWAAQWARGSPFRPARDRVRQLGVEPHVAHLADHLRVPLRPRPAPGQLWLKECCLKSLRCHASSHTCVLQWFCWAHETVAAGAASQDKNALQQHPLIYCCPKRFCGALLVCPIASSVHMRLMQTTPRLGHWASHAAGVLALIHEARVVSHRAPPQLHKGLVLAQIGLVLCWEPHVRHGHSRAGLLAVDADDVAHADLEVGVLEMVLADVHVAHRSLRQRLREARPGCDADLEVLAHVQRPHALVGQDLGQVLQLRVPHALLHTRHSGGFSNLEADTGLCITNRLAPWGLAALSVRQLQRWGQRAQGEHCWWLSYAVELHGLVTNGA